MPSPFPGMDPRIESQRWESFHLQFISDLAYALVPLVRPRYVVLPERRVYVEHSAEDAPAMFVADAAVAKTREGGALPRVARAARQGTAAVVELTLPMPETRREAFLVLRDREKHEVVTVIEVLSPANKRRGGDGQKEYLRKREEILRSASHLVEIDLLRGGERLPTVEPLPAGDFHAFVSRAERRPRVRVRSWTLRERIPAVAVPLAESDPDVELDLQAVFEAHYDRSGYDYSLDPRAPIDPPLEPGDAAWAKELPGA
ncbi:MAG: DUF4058 family protein [Planctomycetes bacterium]|nr:DUF4058 family protein [Planctomycetota bacterium]